MPINLLQLHQRLRACLFEQVIPFWLEHAVDAAGGLNTCITDEGKIVTRDKWLWSQWRSVWVFSRLYRSTKDIAHLQLAEQIVRFCCKHGWTGQEWRLCVAADGKPLREAESIYVDAFAMYGLAEFIRATDDNDARQWLDQTAQSVAARLRQPHEVIPHFPYPIPKGTRVHGIPMIFSLSFFEARDVCGSVDCLQIGHSLADEVMEKFYRPDRDLILERINADGSEAPPPEGTAVVPGHVIESMWFQIHIARQRDDRQRIAACAELIRRHLEIGWDKGPEGIFLAVDANGSANVAWNFADYKLWWPHTEAIYALICAYESTRAPWCLEWLEKVVDYSFSHFPHPSDGEWIQRLQRDGKPTQDVVALPVKDPFHLPRALLLSLESLERMFANAPQTTVIA